MIIVAAVSLSAESVFLKDGSIIEGRIVKDNAKIVQLTLPDDTTQEIQRSAILRILYHDNYKNRRFLTKTDGSVIEIYIVDEDKQTYTYRTDLANSEEMKISKAEVDSISRTKILTVDDVKKLISTALKEEKERDTARENTIRKGGAFLRPGIFISENFSSKRKIGGMIDLFPARFVTERGNGLELFARGHYGSYTPTSTDMTKFNFTSNIPATSTITSKTFSGSKIKYLAGGGGARLIFGGFLRNLFLSQFYISGDFERAKYIVSGNESLSYNYSSYTFSSYHKIKHTYLGYEYSYGIGLELSFLDNLGLFVEAGRHTMVLNGNTKISKTENIISTGITFRSSVFNM
jgi:hypothetical protein